MGCPRDSQRQRVYDSEHAVNLQGEKLDWTETNRFVKKVLASSWTITRFGRRSIVVKDGRGRSHAAAFGTWGIALPRWSRSKLIILHELAHCLRPKSTHRLGAKSGWQQGAAHGWQFCATYLALVRHFMGAEAEHALKKSFQAHRVKFRPPRAKRQLTELQRAALRARMDGLRAMADAARRKSDDTP